MVELISFVPQLSRIADLHGLMSGILKTIVSYILFKSFVVLGGRVKSGLFSNFGEVVLNFAFNLYLYCVVIRQFHIPTTEPTYISFVILYMSNFNDCFMSA